MKKSALVCVLMMGSFIAGCAGLPGIKDASPAKDTNQITKAKLTGSEPDFAKVIPDSHP